MTLTTDPTISAVVDRLRDGFHGRVVTRDDADFETAAGTMYVPANTEPLVVAADITIEGRINPQRSTLRVVEAAPAKAVRIW